MTTQQIVTSQTSPLRIDEIQVPNTDGVLGMTICPGKSGPSESHPGIYWQRDLHDDMQRIAAWGADAVITLLDDADHEFEKLGLDRGVFNRAVVNARMEWSHIRITDKGIPDERFTDVWYDVVRHVLDPIIEAGGKVLIHCNGGLGRTGLVVAQYILERSTLSPWEVIDMVRTARPGTIETNAQQLYLEDFE